MAKGGEGECEWEGEGRGRRMKRMSGKEMDSHNCEDVTLLVHHTQSNQHS